MDVEPGDLLGELLAEDVAGRVGRLEDVREAVEPAGGHQKGPWGEAGLGGPAYDLLALGQEQPVLGLEMGPQLNVAKIAVVGQTRVGRV